MKLNVAIESIRSEELVIAPIAITVDVPKDEMVELLKLYPEVLRLMIEVLKEPE